MLNVLTNARNLILFLFAIANVYSNPSDSIPIAEYCVGYGEKIYCNTDDDCSCDTANVYSNPSCVGYGEKIYYNTDDDYSCDTANVNLHIKKKLREQFEIATCITYFISNSENEALVNRFLIHDDLKAERSTFFTLGTKTWASISSGARAQGTQFLHASGIYWHFADEVPIYAKNGKQFDFNKYYEKGKIIPVEWELKASCDSLYDVVYSGSYFIRITGECE